MLKWKWKKSDKNVTYHELSKMVDEVGLLALSMNNIGIGKSRRINQIDVSVRGVTLASLLAIDDNQNCCV